MALPDECFLGKRIYKKLFYENSNFGSTDKKAFREDIDTIIWQYSLQPSSIQIQSYDDSQREYEEIAILQVNLKTMKRTSRIAKIIHRAIPYPLFIVFVFEDEFAVSLAHKRLSQSSREAVVIENQYMTNWIDLYNQTENQRAFLNSMSISQMPHTHFFALYSTLIERIIALDFAQYTNKYSLENDEFSQSKREKLLNDCSCLKEQIVAYKVDIKKETQFNRKVDLNIKLKEMQKKLRSILVNY